MTITYTSTSIRVLASALEIQKSKKKTMIVPNITRIKASQGQSN